MSYSRGPGVQHWHSIDTIRDGVFPPQGAPSSVVQWGSNNRAIYVPVVVRTRVIVKQLWFADSSTGTGNYDLGLYDAGGTALLRRGSTAKGTTATEVVWDCTDTTIGPGVYYLALVLSVSTDTVTATTALAAPHLAALGCFEEASALPLPATATFAVPQTLTVYPAMGMFLEARVT